MSGIDWATLRKEATTTLEGDFAVVITDAKPGQSGNGKPMIKCTLTVEAGPYVGRKVYSNFTISPESQVALKMFFNAMTTLGLGEEFFAGQPSVEAIAQALLGKRATVVLEGREWNGTMRENVKSWKAPEGGPVATVGVPMVASSSPSSGLAGMTAAPLGAQPSTPAPVMDEGPDPF